MSHPDPAKDYADDLCECGQKRHVSECKNSGQIGDRIMHRFHMHTVDFWNKAINKSLGIKDGDK